jgi:hypothetical protein
MISRSLFVAGYCRHDKKATQKQRKKIPPSKKEGGWKSF